MSSAIMRRKISLGPDLQPIFENESAVQKFEYNVFIEPLITIKSSTSRNQNNPESRTPKGLGCVRPPQPQAAVKKMAAEDQINFVSDTFSWLQKELEGLKNQEQDMANLGGSKDIIHFYKNLMSTVNNLKRVTTTFQEQSDKNAASGSNGHTTTMLIESQHLVVGSNDTKSSLLENNVEKAEKGLCDRKEKLLP